MEKPLTGGGLSFTFRTMRANRPPSTAASYGPARALADVATMLCVSGSSDTGQELRGPAASRRPAEIIRYLRRRAGLTQREVASAAGIHRRAVSYLESGARVPSAGVVVRLCRALLATSAERVLLAESSAEERSARSRVRSRVSRALASRRDHTYCGDVPDSELQGVLETYRSYGRYRAALRRARTALMRHGAIASRPGPCGPVYFFPDGGSLAMELAKSPGPVARALSRFPLDALASHEKRSPYGSMSGYRKYRSGISGQGS